MVVGTPAFMSPEQVQGQPTDHRSDVFSLGIIFYIALTGRRPFEGPQLGGRGIVNSEGRPFGDAPSGRLPEALYRIVTRCLEKSPLARYQRARDLYSDLTAARREIESGAGRSAPGADAEQAIAVLPFQNMSADPENEYFGDGIAEEIINALTQIDGLRVAARTSSFSFKGKSAAIGEIAEKLKVRHVLEGSVRKAGNRVRIAAQLVEASTGYQLWSERYDRQLEDIFDVQDEIARTIVERLKIAFSVAPAGRLVKASTTNMEAYQLYLKGRASLYKRGAWIARALENFRQAVELDPGYADAWAGLADAYTTHGYYGFAPSRETLPRALDAARRAVAIDPDSAGAHSALALPALLWDRDFEMAEREFQRALAINPAYTQARCWYGLMYLQGTTTRLDEGVDEARRAVGFDPLSGYATACYAYALSQARSHVRSRDPGSARCPARSGVVCRLVGAGKRLPMGRSVRRSDRRCTNTFSAASGRHPWPLAGLAATYAKMGKLAEARALHAELLAQRASRFVQPTMLAMSASAAGDHEAAMRFCRECVDERDALFGIFYQHYVDLDRVRADPRFADIVAQFNKRERIS